MRTVETWCICNRNGMQDDLGEERGVPEGGVQRCTCIFCQSALEIKLGNLYGWNAFK